MLRQLGMRKPTNLPKEATNKDHTEIYVLKKSSVIWRRKNLKLGKKDGLPLLKNIN